MKVAQIQTLCFGMHTYTHSDLSLLSFGCRFAFRCGVFGLHLINMLLSVNCITCVHFLYYLVFVQILLMIRQINKYENVVHVSKNALLTF